MVHKLFEVSDKFAFFRFNDSTPFEFGLVYYENPNKLIEWCEYEFGPPCIKIDFPLFPENSKWFNVLNYFYFLNKDDALKLILMIE